jgi:hypothetical protein
VLKEHLSGNAAVTFCAVGVSLSSASMESLPMVILIFMMNAFP